MPRTKKGPGKKRKRTFSETLRKTFEKLSFINDTLQGITVVQKDSSEK